MGLVGPSPCVGAVALLTLLAGVSPRIDSVTPRTAAGGSLTLTLEGTGLDDSSGVPEIYGPDERRVATGTVKSRSSTRVVAEVALAGLSPGTYRVRVRSSSGSRSNPQAMTLTPEVSVSPRSGRPSAVFTYAGRGFTGGFGVTSHLRRPDGREFPSKRIPATAQGTFEEEIQSWEFVPGTYTLWAVDDYTKTPTAPVTFEVEAPRP